MLCASCKFSDTWHECLCPISGNPAWKVGTSQATCVKGKTGQGESGMLSCHRVRGGLAQCHWEETCQGACSSKSHLVFQTTHSSPVWEAQPTGPKSEVRKSGFDFKADPAVCESAGWQDTALEPVAGEQLSGQGSQTPADVQGLLSRQRRPGAVSAPRKAHGSPGISVVLLDDPRTDVTALLY